MKVAVFLFVSIVWLGQLATARPASAAGCEGERCGYPSPDPSVREVGGVIDGDSLPEKQVESLLTGYAAQRLAVPVSDVRLTLLNPESWEGALSAGNGVSLKEVSRGEMLGKATFLMRVQQENKSPASHWVTADVDLIRQIVTAKRLLSGQHVLTVDDLEVRSISLDRPARYYTSEVGDVIGKRVRRTVMKGAPISLDAVDALPVIHPKDRVVLLYQEGDLEIVATGEARGEGYVGGQVAVVNVDSGRLVHGQVVDAMTVRVGAGRSPLQEERQTAGR